MRALWCVCVSVCMCILHFLKFEIVEPEVKAVKISYKHYVTCDVKSQSRNCAVRESLGRCPWLGND
jgi:hypothetical protein